MGRKSGHPVVPGKPPNKAEPARRRGGKGDGQGELGRVQRAGLRGGRCASAIDRVRTRKARSKVRFPRSCPCIDAERLRAAYYALKERRAGSRRREWKHYGEQLEANRAGTERAAQTGSVPSQACTAGVHREGGRAAAAARFPRWRHRCPARRRRRCSTSIYEKVPRTSRRIPPESSPHPALTR